MKKFLLSVMLTFLLVSIFVRCGSNGGVTNPNGILDKEIVNGKIKTAKLEGTEILISGKGVDVYGKYSSILSADQQNPHVIYLPDKKLYFVTWEDFRNVSTTGSDIYGQFMKSDGKICGESFVISNASGNQTSPKAAYRDKDVLDGTPGVDKIVVVWQDTRGGGDAGFLFYKDINVDSLDTTNCTGAVIGAEKTFNFTDAEIYRDGIAVDYVAQGDGSTNSFSLTLSYSPVVAGSVEMSDGEQTIKDNGSGTIGIGTINYTTGVITGAQFGSTPKKYSRIVVKYNINKKQTGTPKAFANLSGLTTFSGNVTTGEVPVVPGSFSISGTGGFVYDNGNATLSGNGSGTIDYSSGTFSFTYSSPLPKGATATISYNYYATYQREITYSKLGARLFSRKQPKINYDVVNDSFGIVWVDVRDTQNISSQLAFNHTPVTWLFGDKNSPAKIELDGNTLSIKNNCLGLNEADLFRNGVNRLNRLISSSSTSLTESYTYEYFVNATNADISSDSTTPETLIVFDGVRNKGEMANTCEDSNNNENCDFWESVTSTFNTSNYDDGLNHIYASFSQDICLASKQTLKIDTGAKDAYYPSVSFDPITKRFITVWEDMRDDENNKEGNTKIYGQLLFSGSGLYKNNFLISYQDTDGDGTQDVNVKDSNQSKPYVTYDSVNQRFFVIWQDGRNGNTSSENLDIFGQYVDLEGSRRGNNYAVSTAPGSQLVPSIAYNNEDNQFFAVWKDARNVNSYGSDVYGQRFSLGNPALFLLNLDNTPFSPPLLNFRTVTLGQFATQSFKIKNVGDTTLRVDYVSAPTFNNFSSTTFQHQSLPDQLSVENDNNYLDLVPGAETTLTVKFSPQQQGSFTSSFIIVSDGGTATVNLQGSSVKPEISLDTNNLDFGNVKVGNSKILSFKITNSGNQTYKITNITGAYAPYTLSGTTNGNLAPGESMTVLVEFKPTQSGNFTVTLDIQTDVAGLSQTVNLIGNGVAPLMSVNTTLLDFGTQLITGTKDLNITLTNNGNYDITSLSYTLNGTAFSIPTSAAAPIAPGNSKTVTVRFSPTDMQTYTGSLIISSDGGDQTISLIGQGATPKITMIPDPSALDFGTVATSSSKTLALTIKNSGNSILTVTSITNPSSPFSYVFSPVFPISLLPGSTYTFTLKFAPSYDGTYSDSLTVTSDASNGNPIVQLQGIAATPTVTVPNHLTFSTIGAGSTETKSFVIQNNGQIDVKIISFDTPQPPFSILNLPSIPFTLAAGTSMVLQVRFAPSNAGSFSSDLKILFEHDLSNASTINFSGTATAQGTTSGGNVLLTPTQLDWGVIDTNSSITKTIVISNTGNQPFNITEISNPTNTAFTINYIAKPTAASPITILPEGSHSISVSFNPTSQGNYVDSFTITTDALNGNQTVYLAGSAIGSSFNFTAPNLVDLGKVEVGSSTTRVYEIVNTGLKDITLERVDYNEQGPIRLDDDADSSAITFSPNKVIKAGEKLTVYMYFMPTEVGQFNTTIHLIFGHLSDTYAINVSGEGLEKGIGAADGFIEVTPSQVDFGTVATGSKNTTTAIIRNVGSKPFTISSISSLSAPFSITYTSDGAMTLFPGSTLPILINFEPSSDGNYNSIFVINSDDAVNAPKTISVRGVAKTAQLTVSPSSLNLGNTKINTKSYSLLEVKNTSFLSYKIISITAPQDYTVDNIDDQTPPYSLSADQTVKFKVSFTPTAKGTIAGNIRILTDSPVIPETTIPVTGNGTLPPILKTDKDTVDFGSVVVGSNTTKALTIYNEGDDTLTITQPTAYPEAFSHVSLGSTTVAANSSTTLTIRFSPTEGKTYSDKIDLVTNAGTKTINLIGTGTTGVMTVDKTTIDFGIITAGATSIQEIKIKNEGEAALTINSITQPSDASFVILNSLSDGTTILTNGEYNLKILYTAPTLSSSATYGSSLGSFTINTSGGNQQILLQAVYKAAGGGIGIETGTTEISVTPSSIDFDKVKINTVSSEKTVTILNSGNTTLTITNISSPTDPAFSILNPPPANYTLDSGASYVLNITYNPTALGNNAGLISINTTAGIKILNLQGYCVATSTTTGGTEGGTSTTGTTTSVSGGGCFIATAAYGSYMEPHVMILRQFRDKHLLTNRMGRTFVDFYYRTSPPIADFIRRHEALRTATRIVLTPIVYIVAFTWQSGVILLILSTVLIVNKKRRKKF